MSDQQIPRSRSVRRRPELTSFSAVAPSGGLLQHLLAGIQYAIGDLKADDAPTR